jgi:hypothetical protein
LAILDVQRKKSYLRPSRKIDACITYDLKSRSASRLSMTNISVATAAHRASAPDSDSSPSIEAIANFQAALSRFTSSETSSGTPQPATVKPQVLLAGSPIGAPASGSDNPAAGSESLVSDDALAKAESLSENWDAWGMHNGVNFNSPPSSLPQDAQDTLHYFASNPTLFSAIVQAAGGQPGGPMTLAELKQYISDAQGDAALAQSLVPPGTPSSAVISNVQELVANWHTWGLHSVTQLSNPPSDLPPDAKAAISFINSNPALLAAIGNGAGSGIITEQDVANFLNKASSDATAGAKAYSDWAAANPNAGAQSQALAQSAASVLANVTLISGGSGELTPSNLASFASSNPNLDPSLTSAAALWSQPGMFKMLDTAGDDLATRNPDQIASSANLSAWISKGALTSDLDFANMMNQAALESTVAGIDTSKLGADVFANPQNYTGAQKAAVMVQLGDLQTKLAVGGVEDDWGAGSSTLSQNADGINPNLSKVQADVQQRIAQLSQDPDVQAYINQTKPSVLQSMVNSDPALHDAVQSYYSGAFQNGDALTNDLNQKDSKGDQVSPTVGLETFTQQASFYDEALGSSGRSLGIMDPQTGAEGQPGPSKLQEIVKNSGNETRLQHAYTDQVVNGGLIKDAIANGADLGTAIGQYAAAAAAYGTGLDPTFLQQNAGALRQNFLDNTSDAIMNSGSATDLTIAFGDQSGNFDVNKVTGVLQQMRQQNPDLFKASDGQALTPDEIVYLIHQAYDLTRNGLSLGDALNKVIASVSVPTGSTADAYKAGTLHLLSAVFGGGVLAAKAAEGAHTPLADASIAATAALMVGTLMEGTAKWAGSASDSLWGVAKPLPQPDGTQLPKEIGNDTVPDSVKKTIENIKSQGKLLGGLGLALNGALGIVAGVGDLKDGDIAGAALNIGSGTASALGGVAGAVEGTAALLSEAGLVSSEFTTIAVAASATFGLVSSGIGVLGALGYSIYGLVKAGINDAHFSDQVLPVLQQYGITGGPFEPGDVATQGIYRNPNMHVRASIYGSNASQIP